MKKLLILIPAYNESDKIEKVIEGIPDNIQGIDFIEVLVINDGSTDNTYSSIKNSELE